VKISQSYKITIKALQIQQGLVHPRLKCGCSECPKDEGQGLMATKPYILYARRGTLIVNLISSIFLNFQSVEILRHGFDPSSFPAEPEPILSGRTAEVVRHKLQATIQVNFIRIESSFDGPTFFIFININRTQQ